MKVIKRDGSAVDYMPEKIENAIIKANNEVMEEDQVSTTQIKNIIRYIESLGKSRILVEDIQDIIEMRLMSIGKYALAKKYITYRYTRELVRKSNTTDLAIRQLLENDTGTWDPDRSGRTREVTRQREYLAGITSTDITRRMLLPEDVVAAHDAGLIHFHDADHFAQNALHNSGLIDLADMLENGTVINGRKTSSPEGIREAFDLASRIIAAVSASQYGALTVTLARLSPYVGKTRQSSLERYLKEGMDPSTAERLAREDTEKRARLSVKSFLFGMNALGSVSGRRCDLTVCMYPSEAGDDSSDLVFLIGVMLDALVREGVPEGFRSVYVLEESNALEGSPLWDLTLKAAGCTALRGIPEYISEKVMKRMKVNALGVGDCYPPTGDGAFLTPDRTFGRGNISGAAVRDPKRGKYYGRFDQGTVTLNLADAALSSEKDPDRFSTILEERLELAHRALQVRQKRLARVTGDVAPILWQHGALARLEEGESIRELLYHGYSTLSLGFSGLYECVRYMTGASVSDAEAGRPFAVSVMKALRDATDRWREDEDIDYTVYGAVPAAVNEKFAECLKDRFGAIRGITDRDRICESYHMPAGEDLDVFTKLTLEEELASMCTGGGKAYIDAPDLVRDRDSVGRMMAFIYDSILLARLNVRKTPRRGRRPKEE